jgi:sugar O-acyltransferase (sialic acid O-acetyltransferase NeuD family)
MSRKKIYIYGCGGQGQESAEVARRAGYSIAGFIDDGYLLDTYEGVEVVPLQNVNKVNNVSVAVGNPDTKRKIVSKLESFGFCNFPILIDPDSTIFKGVTLYPGVLICAGSVITTNAVLEKFVSVNINATVSHRSIIKKYSSVAPSSAVNGDCSIGEDCFIGSGAIIKEKISVCDHVTIGAGAVVVKNIDAPGTFVGVPATRKRGL